VGDLNHDGKADIVTANSCSSDVFVLLGKGDGTFKAQSQYLAHGQPQAVAMGDFTGNGVLDIVTANTTSDDLSILVGNEDGTFQAPHNIPLGSGVVPAGVAVADLSDDGKAGSRRSWK
jgi:hypothetical protein